MEKFKLHKDDIEILDNILKTCIKNSNVRTIDLNPPKHEFLSNMNIVKEEYYLRFFQIIESQGIATISSTLDSSCLKSNTPVIERFYDEGGFKKLYEDQQKSVETEKILQEKSVNEAVLFKWQKKTYWWTFGIAMTGFIIATIALILTIVKK